MNPKGNRKEVMDLAAQRQQRAIAWIRSLPTGEFTRMAIAKNIGCTYNESKFVIWALLSKGLIEKVNNSKPRTYGLIGRAIKATPAKVATPIIDPRTDREKSYWQFRSALNILPVESLASRFTNRGN